MVAFMIGQQYLTLQPLNKHWQN